MYSVTTAFSVFCMYSCSNQPCAQQCSPHKASALLERMAIVCWKVLRVHSKTCSQQKSLFQMRKVCNVTPWKCAMIGMGQVRWGWPLLARVHRDSHICTVYRIQLTEKYRHHSLFFVCDDLLYSSDRGFTYELRYEPHPIQITPDIKTYRLVPYMAFLDPNNHNPEELTYYTC